MESVSNEKSTNVRIVSAGLRALEQLSPDWAAQIVESIFTHPRRYARPLREEELRVAGRSFTLRVGRRLLPAWRWGQGPIALLVHGWEGRGTQLGAFVEPLCERGYQVVAFDARAHGDADGENATLLDFVHAIEAVEEQCGAIAALIAHSFGAAAATVAIDRGVQIGRMVYVAPAGPLEDGIAKFVDNIGLGPATRERVKRRLETRTHTSMNRLAASLARVGRKTPLLVVHDLRDKEVSVEEGRALATRWTDAELIETDGLGHRRVLWDERVTEAAADFVAELGKWSEGDAVGARSLPCERRFAQVF